MHKSGNGIFHFDTLGTPGAKGAQDEHERCTSGAQVARTDLDIFRQGGLKG